MANPSYMEGNHAEALLDLHRQEDSNSLIRQQTMKAAQDGAHAEKQTEEITANLVQAEATREAVKTHQATQDAYRAAQPQRPEAPTEEQERRTELQEGIIEASNKAKSSTALAKALRRAGDTKEADKADKVSNDALQHLASLENSALNMKKDKEARFASVAGSVDFDDKGDPTNLRGVVEELKRIAPERVKKMEFDKDLLGRVIWGKNTEQSLKTMQTQGENAHQQLLTKQALANAKHQEQVLEQTKAQSRLNETERGANQRRHMDGLKREDIKIGQTATKIGQAAERMTFDKGGRTAEKAAALLRPPTTEELEVTTTMLQSRLGLSEGEAKVAAWDFSFATRELMTNDETLTRGAAEAQARTWLKDKGVTGEGKKATYATPATPIVAKSAPAADAKALRESGVARDLSKLGVGATMKGGVLSLTGMTRNATPENKAILDKAQTALNAGVSPEKVAAILKAKLGK